MQSIIRPKYFVLVALLALAGLTITACGSSAEKLNQEGNEAFAKQAYEEALAAYETAQIEAPELAEPYYNAANSLYRQEKYTEALEQMQRALPYAQEEELAQNSHFNMGNTAYSTQEWESAIESYKQALLLNPDDPDAKYNLELALQQQEQQEQQQQDQEQQQEQSEDGESQENEQEQSQENEQQQDQEQDQSQQGDDQQEQEQDQSQQGDDQQEQDQSQENDQPNESEDQQQEQDKGQQQDQESRDNEGQSRQDQPQDQQSPSSQVPRPGQRMTEDQARQLLEAIAGDSDTLQERLGQYYLVPMRPSVQDW